MIKHLCIKKTSENKRVLYELAKPILRYDERPSDYADMKPKLFKAQEKEYGEYWIKRKTNYQINHYVMPLKRSSQVPRMNKIQNVSGALFEIKESGGYSQTDFVMKGSITKNGDIDSVEKMRNGFVEHVSWDKNNVKHVITRERVFDVDEAGSRDISKLAKRFLKKYAKTILEKVK